MFCLIFLSPLGSSANPEIISYKLGGETILGRAKPLDDGYDVKGEIDGDKKFFLSKYSLKRTDIIIYINGHQRFRMPDITVTLPNGESYPPGMTYKAYAFYLSPNQNYLFVVRGLARDEIVGYLYRRLGRSRMCPMRPLGLRFDESALTYYFHKHNLRFSMNEIASRDIHFVKWGARSRYLAFTMSVASFWAGEHPQRGDIDLSWYSYFDFKKNRFRQQF